MPNWAIAPAITTGKVGGDTVPASVCAVEPVRVVIGSRPPFGALSFRTRAHRAQDTWRTLFTSVTAETRKGRSQGLAILPYCHSVF